MRARTYAYVTNETCRNRAQFRALRILVAATLYTPAAWPLYALFPARLISAAQSANVGPRPRRGTDIRRLLAERAAPREDA
jgi:hypothetical protein